MEEQKWTTLLTDNYVKHHRLFVESMNLYNSWFKDIEHVILFKSGKLTDFDYIKTYLSKVKFVEVPRDFYKNRNTTKMFYPHFVETFDKLYIFFANELSGCNFVLYDADMVCLQSFAPPTFFNNVKAALEPSGWLNTGFVLFPESLITKEAQNRINSFENRVVSLPDQEIINKTFAVKPLRNIKILIKTLKQINTYMLQDSDILHYVSSDKDVFKRDFMFNNDIQKLIQRIWT